MGLRFVSDEDYRALAEKAEMENLSEKEIEQTNKKLDTGYKPSRKELYINVGINSLYFMRNYLCWLNLK